jgi:hypothetical protein
MDEKEMQHEDFPRIRCFSADMITSDIHYILNPFIICSGVGTFVTAHFSKTMELSKSFVAVCPNYLKHY